MNKHLRLPLGFFGLLFVSAASAQTGAAAATGWGQKPGGSPSSTLSAAGASSFGSNKLLHSSPGSTLNSSMSTATYGATPTQATMISYNRHYRAAQRHSDANNPLLHPQPMTSTPGFASPASMTPASTSGWQSK